MGRYLICCAGPGRTCSRPWQAANGCGNELKSLHRGLVASLAIGDTGLAASSCPPKALPWFGLGRHPSAGKCGEDARKPVS